MPDGAPLKVLDGEVSDFANPVEVTSHDGAITLERLRVQLNKGRFGHQIVPEQAVALVVVSAWVFTLGSWNRSLTGRTDHEKIPLQRSTLISFLLTNSSIP